VRFVLYFKETYSIDQVEQLIDIVSKCKDDKFFLFPASENRLEVLEVSFSIKKFVKCVAMKLKLWLLKK